MNNSIMRRCARPGILLATALLCYRAFAADPPPLPPPPAPLPLPVQKVEKVEVKSSQESYDARREDVATKIVVTAEEIGKFGDAQLADVLKRQPGVTVINGEIRMRGLGSGYTQILLNGERAPPGFSLDTLAPSMVERIEILRAATAEFSTQAVAGTINIILKKKATVGQRELTLGWRSGHGYQSPNLNFNLSDKEGNFSWSVSGSGSHNLVDDMSSATESASDAKGVQSYFRSGTTHFVGKPDFVGISPRLNWTLANGDTLGWQSFFNYVHDTSNADRRYDILTGPLPQYLVSLTRNRRQDVLARSDLSWVHKMAEGAKLDMKIGVSLANRDVEFLQRGFAAQNMQTLDSAVRSSSKDSGVTFTGKYSTPIVEGHALVAGWESGISNRSETRDQRDEPIAGFTPVVSFEEFDASVLKLAAFAQDEWNVNQNWSVYLGIRWEGLTTTSDGNTYNEIRNRSSVWSPLMQTLYKLPERKGEQLRFSLTRTYKAPATASLIPRRFTSTNNGPTEPDSQGNPQLRPELATGIDVAAEKFWEKGAMMSLAASLRRITDFNRRGLAFTTGRWVAMPINDGRATTRSLEFDTKFPLQFFVPSAPPIDFRLNLNRNWSTVEAVPGPNNRLDQQTPFSGTVGMDYRMKGGEFTAGGSYSFRSGGPVRISETQGRYFTAKRDFDVYTLFKFSPKTQFRLALANLLRQDFLNETSFVDASGSVVRRSIFPSSVRISANLELKL